MENQTDSRQLPETLQRHWLCRVLVDGTPMYKVLCLLCRNRESQGFKRISFSEQACDRCGESWKLPPGLKALKCKDKTVTTTARYPDLETARNSVS